MSVPLLSGEPFLDIAKRKVLNLWTETGDCHLGHLHMMRTAAEIVKQGHKVTFYVGEFNSSLWPTPEFRRMEEHYTAARKLLEACVEGASSDSAFGARDPEVAGGRALYSAIVTTIAANGPDADLRVDPARRADFQYIYERTWGGVGSPFCALFALYASINKFDALLIAERHAKIGRALIEFTAYWKKHKLELITVPNFNSIVPSGVELFMSSSNGAVRMQEPWQYLERRLEKATPAQRETFVSQCYRLLFKRELGKQEFADWWTKEGAATCSQPHFAPFTKRDMEGLFDAYRATAHNVIPATQQHSYHHVNNAFLLKYVGLVLQRWHDANGAPSVEEGLLQNVKSEVNDHADDFERSYYDDAFKAVTDALAVYNNPAGGMTTPVVKRLLELTAWNRTTDLLLFFGARKVHRDHYVHTFNVAALGQFFLDLHVAGGKQLKDHISSRAWGAEAVWWLTAMLHDHAYPFYSMMQWMERLRPLSDKFKSERDLFKSLAEKHLDSLRFVHTDLRAILKASIDDEKFGLDYFWSATRAKRENLFWFLDAEDRAALTAKAEIDHGYAAVLNIAYHLEEFDADVRDKDDVRQLLRGILFHTKVPLAKGKLAPVSWKGDPMAYLLLVCDELQEWSRRTLQEKDGQGVFGTTPSELMLAPLSRRIDKAFCWQVPGVEYLDVTVRYTDRSQVEKWTSHDFHKEKTEMFNRLQMDKDDPFPRLRLNYALATQVFPKA